MYIKVLKRLGDKTKPDMMEIDTKLKVGDKLKLEYDWCKRQNGICGEIKNWHKDVCEFTVVDIVCNMLGKPHTVWVRLSSNDELFYKRCGIRQFDTSEQQALERRVA